MPSPVILPYAFLQAPLAHRGLHDRSQGRPENSRAAFRAAIEAGYGIELDVQPSADNVPMVFHDYDLRRLTGIPGRIRGHTAAELQSMRLLGSDETIPTLAEVLRLVAGQVPVLIEIKDQDGAMGPEVGPLEEAVAIIVMAYRGPVAVMSFNPHSMAVMARAAPGIARGLVTSAYDAEDWPLLPARIRDHLRDIPDYDRVWASFVSHEAADLGRPRLDRIVAQKGKVLCWTIRSPEAEAAARTRAHNVTFEGYAAAMPG